MKEEMNEESKLDLFEKINTTAEIEVQNEELK